MNVRCLWRRDGELYSWTLYEVLPDGAGGVSLTEYYY